MGVSTSVSTCSFNPQSVSTFQLSILSISLNMCFNYNSLAESTTRPTILSTHQHQGTPPIIIISNLDTDDREIKEEEIEKSNSNSYLSPPAGKFGGLENPWTYLNLTPFQPRIKL